MSLNPRFVGQKLGAGSPKALHTLEFYLDYVCPFSQKMFLTLYSSVFPKMNSKYTNKVQFIFRQQIQPWHPSSTLTHEAGAAVLKLSPDKFWDFSETLFKRQTEFFDVNVVNETRNATYKRLAEIGKMSGVNEEKMYALLEVGDQPGKDGAMNIGNGVTDDIKLMVKTNRQVGVHVTPTVLFNGVVENGISSSSGLKEWEEWLEKNIV